MKLKIYASYDKLTCELNNRTFLAPNDDVAKNIVENGFYGMDGKLDQATVRNAKNYKLIQLGEYDTECGITGYGPDYKVVAEFKDLIPKQEEDSPKTE